jgi:hypothetical protein
MKVAITTIALSLALTVCAVAQETPSVLRGSWTATIGASRVIGGSWTATIDSAKPDAARGAWVLVDEGNRVVLEGTWSAEKSPRGWQGTWSARVGTGSSRAGRGAASRVLSGSWRADIKDPNVRTLAEMLHRAIVDGVTGSWRSGALEGGWRLKG